MADNSEDYVFDSFAVIAYLENETGAEQIEEFLYEAQEEEVSIDLSMINYGEILYITERETDENTTKKVISLLDHLPVSIIDVDRDLTFSAAHLKANYPIAYADAYAAALAQQKNAQLVTGDPEFEEVQHLVNLCWL